MQLRPTDCSQRALPYALADGRVALLRPVGPEDAPLHLEAMRRLSADSRRARFLDAGLRPSAALSHYLTAVDQLSHVAWGATLAEPQGSIGIGLVRFVCEPQDPSRAELAVTVIDAYQGLGLGRGLLRLGLRLARRQGVRCLTGLLRADNHRMLAFARRQTATLRPLGEGLLEARIELLRSATDRRGPRPAPPDQSVPR